MLSCPFSTELSALYMVSLHGFSPHNNLAISLVEVVNDPQSSRELHGDWRFNPRSSKSFSTTPMITSQCLQITVLQ